MKILLLTAYFLPDTGSAAHLFYELGTALVERGHQVTVVTGMPGYHAQGSLERYKGKKWIREKVNGMDVVRIAVPSFPRHLMAGRALWQFTGAATSLLAGLCLSHHDVSIVYSPPLPLGLAAWGLQSLRDTPFILNVQDLFPQSIIDLGLLKNRWIIAAFEAMERFIYARATHITVHSEGNRHHIVSKGAAEDKVTVIPNWVDIEFIRPADRMNGLRKENGWDDTFIVSFAGILGYSQDLDVVLEAAGLINHPQSATYNSKILFLIVGDGVEKARLQTKARQMGLANVRFLPMQPRERYPSVLHASDVCLVTLHDKVKTPVVPSKILSIMAAGRPVVAAVDLNGDAPRLIEQAQCGFCVPSEDPHALAEAVLLLYRDPSLREELGRNGRQYAEEHLSLQACVGRYEELLYRVVVES
ncbi:MAG: glycosyltransferase family 4 protein [Candidatus Oleimicrobiaceae bacterium]